MEFNKLVRDKIPQMIESQGEKPVIRILGEEEYHAALEQKLLEEAGEYRESRELAELADILEVVFALCEADGIQPVGKSTKPGEALQRGCSLSQKALDKTPRRRYPVFAAAGIAGRNLGKKE